MNNDFGELSNLVRTAGLLVSASFAIALAWRGRTRWEPSQQDLPQAPQRIAGLLNAVILAVLWVFLASPSHASLLAVMALALSIGAVLCLIFYFLHVAILTFELPSEPAETGQPANAPERIVGGYWLTAEAARKKLQKTNPIPPSDFLVQTRQADKVWPRAARAIAKVAFILGYVGFVVCGTAGLTCAAMLFMVGKPPEVKVPQDVPPVNKTGEGADSRIPETDSIAPENSQPTNPNPQGEARPQRQTQSEPDKEASKNSQSPGTNSGSSNSNASQPGTIADYDRQLEIMVENTPPTTGILYIDRPDNTKETTSVVNGRPNPNRLFKFYHDGEHNFKFLALVLRTATGREEAGNSSGPDFYGRPLKVEHTGPNPVRIVFLSGHRYPEPLK